MAKLIIGEIDISDPDKPYKPVLLDDEEIFKIDLSTYMGHRRFQEPEICKALSEKLGYDVDARTLNMALILQSIPDEEPDDEE